jgi:rod shape-determining protein MreC
VIFRHGWLRALLIWAALPLIAVGAYALAARAGIGRAARDSGAPHLRFAAEAREFFGSIKSSLRGRSDAAIENAALSDEASALRAKLLVFEELQRENAALRAAMKLAPRNFGGIRAEVVSRGGAASGWLQTVRIDKGERDGVRKSAPVVNENGLVGRILETTARTADVLLLADPNSKVSCHIEREGAGANGILSGGGFSPGAALELSGIAKPLTVDYLGKDIELRAGDRILTSGLGGVFPRGLPVGEIMESAAVASGLYNTAKIAPYVDFSTVSLVYVLPFTASAPEADPD